MTKRMQALLLNISTVGIVIGNSSKVGAIMHRDPEEALHPIRGRTIEELVEAGYIAERGVFKNRREYELTQAARELLAAQKEIDELKLEVVRLEKSVEAANSPSAVRNGW